MNFRTCRLLAIVSSFCFPMLVLAAEPYASAKPMTEPVLFAPEVISTGDYESHPAFSPDGKTLYFVKSNPSFDFWTIVVSHFQEGKWTTPETAPFSGQYSDADPFITRDGKRFYFISNRPVPGKSAPDLDIWVMEKSGDGWSEPNNLGAPINSDRNEWFPSMADNGTIYFGSERGGGKGGCDLYCARLQDGKYIDAENLGDAINTKYGEFEPCIAPDEKWLIFAAANRADGKGQFDLFVSSRENGTWSAARNFGDKINTPATEFSPRISPDGKYLFFSSTRGFADAPLASRLTFKQLEQKLRAPGNGLGDIYQVELSALELPPDR